MISKPPTRVEILKKVLGKKFKVEETDGSICIANKSTKNKNMVLMRVKIVAYGGIFDTK